MFHHTVPIPNEHHMGLFALGPIWQFCHIRGCNVAWALDNNFAKRDNNNITPCLPTALQPAKQAVWHHTWDGRMVYTETLMGKVIVF